jgi:HD-GYP domain-containing protein (c-di-GMP phosphodiesterase class II)
MFAANRCNMTNNESYIRAVIAAFIMLYAFINQSFILGTLAMVIFYTAFTKFCFLYAILKINKNLENTSYYLTLLPKYRTSPAFIFDADGKIVFENKPGHRICGNIHQIEDLNIYNYKQLIEDEKEDNMMYHHGVHHFQIEVIPVKKEKLILAYFTDVTEVLALNDEIEETQREIIYAMGEIGETRSKETGNHVKRVAEYSRLLAELYGLPSEEAQKLKMASLMHDIGKVGIPDAILNAPRKLTKEEFEVMKTHASLGYNMLKHSNKEILQAAAIVANEHHEKYDGSGYPNALQGEDIHIYGRITAIADVFDALGSDRVYKKAWSLEKILVLFQEESAKHFDPKLTKLFLDNLELFLVIRNKFKD